MPYANYCRKCKAETPDGETCPYCGKALTKTGRRLSFGVIRTPWKDWFSWNELLRIALPMLGMIALMILLSEGLLSGVQGLLALLARGFVFTMMAILGIMLLLILILLILQGPEKVHYILDKDGVTACTYVDQGKKLPRIARFVTADQADFLSQTEHALPGLTLVKRVILPWEKVRRVRIWQEGQTILFYRPSWWQALAMPCPPDDMPEAENFIRQKMKRIKDAKVQPEEKKPAKKRRR